MRPDKIILEGLKSLNSITGSFYSSQKSTAKANAEVTFIGRKKLEKIHKQLYIYNLKEYQFKEDQISLSFISNPTPKLNHWLNYHGLHNVEAVREVCDLVGLDRLTVRQIVDTTQRPKVVQHPNLLFVTVKSIIKQASVLNIEQMSFILGPHFLISFQEEMGDHFDAIRHKLEDGIGFLRSKSCDYLLLQMLDAILDNYFETLEKSNHELATIESTLFSNNPPDQNTLFQLESHKRATQLIKKALSPFKDAVANILNDKTQLIKEENIKYYRDIHNSVLTAIEETESTLRTLEGLTNIYFASLSQRMNETMKVLTTVATIFIPLTFIAGIYGMNFENMPELKWPNGYFMIWGLMGGIFLIMLWYFRRKRWL